MNIRSHPLRECKREDIVSVPHASFYDHYHLDPLISDTLELLILDVQVFRKSLISYSRILRTDHVKSKTYTPLIVVRSKKVEPKKINKINRL